MAKKWTSYKKFGKKMHFFTKKKGISFIKSVRDWNHAVGGHWTERRRWRKPAAE